MKPRTKSRKSKKKPRAKLKTDLRKLETKIEGNRCKHPPCTCKTKPGVGYCSTQCEAMGETPDIDCRCGHAKCKGRVD